MLKFVVHAIAIFFLINFVVAHSTTIACGDGRNAIVIKESKEDISININLGGRKWKGGQIRRSGPYSWPPSPKPNQTKENIFRRPPPGL